MVADYLGLPRALVQHALATVALTGQEEKLVKDYSLGMKQRLGLAMALLADPPLMLLDEPTNGLDPAGVAEIRELIVTLTHQESMTVIISSHILNEIEQKPPFDIPRVLVRDIQSAPLHAQRAT